MLHKQTRELSHMQIPSTEFNKHSLVQTSYAKPWISTNGDQILSVTLNVADVHFGQMTT